MEGRVGFTFAHLWPCSSLAGRAIEVPGSIQRTCRSTISTHCRALLTKHSLFNIGVVGKD